MNIITLFITLFIVAIVAGIVIGIVVAINTSKRQKEIDASITAVPGFTATYQYRGADGINGIAIDESNEKVCLVSHSIGGSVTNRVVSYRDIISSELFEDGTTITKTVRSSQIGGAVVGGLLLGGVGAVIGGLSGKRVETGKVKRIDLRLVINDAAQPTHSVCFLATETDRNGFVYKMVAEQARQWQARFDVLIKRTEREDTALGQQQAEKPVSSDTAERVKCPYCAEMIMPDAKICRFCGRDIPTAISPTDQLS